jgi:hypothetical protein
MPDFSATFTAGAELVPWTDPPDEINGRPTRLNPLANHEHRRRVAIVGEPVTIAATVNRVSEPADADLEGRLFLLMFAETPGGVLPVVSSPAGQSSVKSFTPQAAGHYCFALRRAEGGGIFMHLDAVD